MKKSLLTYIAPIYFLCFLTFSCGNDKKQESNPPHEMTVLQPPMEQVEPDKVHLTKEQIKESGVIFGPLVERSFHKEIECSGQVDLNPKNKAELSSYYGGYITKLYVIPGQWVNKGDALVEVDNPEFLKVQEEYLEVTDKIQYLQSENKRLQALANEKAIAEKTALLAESKYQQAVNKSRFLKEKMRVMGISVDQVSYANIQTKLSLPAPISGYVQEVNTVLGAYCDPHESLISIVNVSHPHIELQVFEKDIGYVSNNQTVTFQVQNDPTTYYAKVFLINQFVNEDTKTVQVHAHLAKSSQAKKLRIGQYVNAHIQADNYQVLCLPDEAIVTRGDVSHGLVVESQTDNEVVLKTTELDIGLSENEYVEIKNADDFASNAEFVTNLTFELLNE